MRPPKERQHGQRQGQHHEPAPGVTGLVNRGVAGIAGGLVGGVAFGLLMQVMGMIPMVAMLVGSNSAGIGGWSTW